MELGRDLARGGFGREVNFGGILGWVLGFSQYVISSFFLKTGFYNSWISLQWLNCMYF